MIRWATVTDVTAEGVWVVSSWLQGKTGPIPVTGSPSVGEPVLVVRTDDGELAAVHGAIPTRVRWKSGSIAPWNYGAFADLPQILSEVEALGLNTVNIPVPVAAVDINDSEPAVDAGRLAWALEIADALPANVRIIAEPYPWIDDGNQSETLWDPSDVPLWFESWTAACVEVAQAFPQAEMVYVGSNMVTLEGGHDADWIAVADAVRAVTSAKVSYRCNWWYEDARLNALCAWTFLQALDVVSVAAYFELTDTPTPDYDEIRAALDCSLIYDRGQDIVGDVRRLAQATGRPIFFGELVCSHWEGALSAPWNPDVGSAPRTRDRMVQRRMYAAYADAFAGFPWWLGFSVYGVAGFGDSGYVLDGSAVDFLHRL